MGTTRTCSSCGDSISGTLDHCPKDGTPLFSAEVMSRVGTLVRDYEIQGVIGEGGMGVVYRAQHVVIEKPVAIKVLHDRFARQKEMVDQFIVEAKAASRIRHPNTIDVTDFGITPDGLVFLVMEFLDGESLQDRLARVGRIPIFEAVNIVKQVARGLGAAHDLGIVHRDLKPANVFLCEREGRRRIVRRLSDESGPQFTVEAEGTFDLVKLLDFGVAKFLDLGPSSATRAGVLCGTPHYLSPEQAQEQSATERSDIYALGVVFYEMVTGRVPFDGDSMFEILNGHVAGEVVKPSQRLPELAANPYVDATILRCLEKQPERRFANTDELCDALAACVSDRAFLRDAHRLPGIESSGIALPKSPTITVTGRSTSEVLAEKGFSQVEREGRNDGLPDWNDQPGVGGDSPFPRETMQIRAAKTGLRLGMLVLSLLVGAGATWWFLRPDHALNSTASAIAPPALPSQTPSIPALAPPSPSRTEPFADPSPEPKSLPEPQPSPAIEPTNPGAAPDPVAKTLDLATERSAPARTRSVLAGNARGKDAVPPSHPSLGVPTPASPPLPRPEPASPPPPPPPPPPAPKVDAEALLREAQQAWTHQYYAVAIDKARTVLKSNPDEQAAHQIIAVCSCALGLAEDAKQAVAHLDAHKHKLVQSLCQRHGVSLE